MATCSDILAWKIPWTEEPCGGGGGGEGGESHSEGCKELDTTEPLSTHTCSQVATKSPSNLQIAPKPFKLYKVTLGLPWWSSG